MKSKLINWKKKTGIYIGRFQPIHDGHYEIIKKAIKKNGRWMHFNAGVKIDGGIQGRSPLVLRGGPPKTLWPCA